jgi:hypothetical protein
MRTLAHLFLIFLAFSFQTSLRAESTPNPKSYRGGWITQTALPEGIESTPWKESKFALHISIQIDQEGKVTEATPIDYWVKEMPEWQRPFLDRGIEALKKWRFSPLYEGDRKSQTKLIGWGMTLHLEFSQNDKGDKNLTIHQGVGRVFITTGTFWRPE